MAENKETGKHMLADCLQENLLKALKNAFYNGWVFYNDSDPVNKIWCPKGERVEVEFDMFYIEYTGNNYPYRDMIFSYHIPTVNKMIDEVLDVLDKEYSILINWSRPGKVYKYRIKIDILV